VSEEAENRIFAAAAAAYIANLKAHMSFCERLWSAADNDSRPAMPAKFGSPIERLFFVGLFAARESIQYGRKYAEAFAREYPGERYTSFECQYSVGRKRVDFALFSFCVEGTLDGAEVLRKSIVAVECDGEAFHHGDPKAVAKDKARDRELSEHFDAILRFTGAELYADAYSCAKQALRVAEAKLR